MRPTASRRDAAFWRDSACLFCVIVGLCLVHFGLPASVHEQLVFRYGNPIALTPWTAVLVHDSVGHLASNLLAYLVVIGPTYALYRTWGRRRRFWLLMRGVIIIVPPLVSAADYWLLYQRWGLAGPQTVGFGFSGVVSGLVGVLAASTVGSVADWYGRRSAVYVAVALAGSWGIAVLTTTGRSVSRLCAFPLSIGLAIVGIAGIVRQWRSIPVEALQQIHRNQLWVIGTSFLVAWVLTVALFQIEGSVTPRFVNVIAHGTGLLTGINLTIWNEVR